MSSEDRGEFFYNIDCIGSALSCLLLFAVGMLILSDKRVRAHPNNIIALILLADSYTYCQYLTRFIVCGFNLNAGLDRLFCVTIQYPIHYVLVKIFGREVGPYNWDDMLAFYDTNGCFQNTIQLRLAAWYLTTVFAVYISLFLQSFTILDLYLVLKNPFASSENRVKKFIAISIAIASFLSIVVFGLTIV